MSRTFAYVRVSSTDGRQTTENQIQEIRRAGYEIPENRVISEEISGSVPVMERPQFAKLLDRLEPGDCVVCRSVCRIGRDAIDVMGLISWAKSHQIKLVILQLGEGLDLCSTAGQVVVSIMAILAEAEKQLLIERTKSGLARFVSNGGKLGRKPKTTPEQQISIRQALAEGVSVSQLSRDYKVSRATILSINKAAA